MMSGPGMCKSLAKPIATMVIMVLVTGCTQQVVSSSVSMSTTGAVSSQIASANVPSSSTVEYPYTESLYGGTVLTFESELVGWKTDYNGTGTGPHLYETADGGETWAAAQVDILPEMLEGLSEFRTYPVEWKGDHWEFALLALRKPGYPSWGFYEYSLNPDKGAWTWNDPQWPMPEGVDQIYFMDFVAAYFAESPEEYDYQVGLTTASTIFWLVQDTADFEERFGRELPLEEEQDVVPYEAIDRMAGYLYGDLNFDAKSLQNDFREGERSTDVGYYRDYPTWRREGYQALVIDATATDDGNIEAIVATFYYADGFQYDAAAPDTLFRRCVFRPIMAEGIQMFTLISAEKIDRPIWYNGSPGPH